MNQEDIKEITFTEYYEANSEKLELSKAVQLLIEFNNLNFIIQCLNSHVDKLSEIFAYWATYYLEYGYSIEYTDDNERQKDKKRSIELYKDAADRFYPDSAARYAVYLMSNYKKDDDEEIMIKYRQNILQYLHIAADRGHSDAYCYLGDIFCNESENDDLKDQIEKLKNELERQMKDK
ncbi:6643_t:CDS:2 [Dentiscutata heterogama]|uniref:6643_t:CDS:1 n=1 Tax=Dentiscutata heterogama TaxID=1316150 RepID=A0ACA9LE93_9GLOM|nr:6643_t:CDS:2 [Dentiscutata heterogama]